MKIPMFCIQAASAYSTQVPNSRCRDYLSSAPTEEYTVPDCMRTSTPYSQMYTVFRAKLPPLRSPYRKTETQSFRSKYLRHLLLSLRSQMNRAWNTFRHFNTNVFFKHKMHFSFDFKLQHFTFYYIVISGSGSSAGPSAISSSGVFSTSISVACICSNTIMGVSNISEYFLI